MGALYDNPQRWVRPGEHSADCRVPIRARLARWEMQVRPGRYALAFAHDEDGDGELDRDWIGIPQEGFGFSNDAAPGLGPPSFESARFAHEEASTTLSVRARYGI